MNHPKKTHLPKKLVAEEIIFQKYITIEAIKIILKSKYGIEEDYYWIESTISSFNLQPYIRRKCSKTRQVKLIQDEKLRDLLFDISKKYNRIFEYQKILHYNNYNLSNYRVKELLKYYKLYYKTYDEKKQKKIAIPKKEVQKVKDYCITVGIDINHLKVKDLIHLYNKFEYNWLYQKITYS